MPDARSNPDTRLLSARLHAGDAAAARTIQRLLDRHQGSVAAAARELGIRRATLNNWLLQLPVLKGTRYRRVRGRVPGERLTGIEVRGTPGPAPGGKSQEIQSEKARSWIAERSKTHRPQVLAHRAVGLAIRRGDLQRMPCEACDSRSVYTHAHHDDYAKPLEIRWLCAGCHAKWHAINGEAKNARSENCPEEQQLPTS